MQQGTPYRPFHELVYAAEEHDFFQSEAKVGPARDQDLTKCGSAKPDLTTFLLLGRKKSADPLIFNESRNRLKPSWAGGDPSLLPGCKACS
jgi:hypothetical protein